MNCGVENHTAYKKEDMKECQNCGQNNCPDCLSYDNNKCHHCGEDWE